ncbi:hypothetical protein GJ496_007262 [Pomphorhynchus laevis]|nr:hypothetical protein GJ496_007262 [Pomphorhynchus laevis]KAI0978637.1 hypothetical protein GJ496_007262 [Pomphorhynchus laevis]
MITSKSNIAFMIILLAELFVNNQVHAKNRNVPNLEILQHATNYEIRSILDDICATAKKFGGEFVGMFLDGGICNWNGRKDSIKETLQMLYNFFENAIIDHPQIGAALDVLENRYMNSRDIRPIKYLAKAGEDSHITLFAKQFIPLIVTATKGMNNAGIKRSVNLGLTILEAYSQGDPFARNLIMTVNRFSAADSSIMATGFSSYLKRFGREIYRLPQSYNDRTYKQVMSRVANDFVNSIPNSDVKMKLANVAKMLRVN